MTINPNASEGAFSRFQAINGVEARDVEGGNPVAVAFAAGFVGGAALGGALAGGAALGYYINKKDCPESEPEAGGSAGDTSDTGR